MTQDHVDEIVYSLVLLAVLRAIVLLVLWVRLP